MIQKRSQQTLLLARCINNLLNNSFFFLFIFILSVLFVKHMVRTLASSAVSATAGHETRGLLFFYLFAKTSSALSE